MMTAIDSALMLAELAFSRAGSLLQKDRVMASMIIGLQLHMNEVRSGSCVLRRV
jgi:hypothetical protein